MSSKNLLPTERESGSNTEPTGTMKGTLINLRTAESYDYFATYIYRDKQGGTLRFHGSMKNPEIPEKYVSVGLQLSKHDEASGEFEVGDPRILHLFYMQYDKDVYFDAASGNVVFQRGEGQDEINGRLLFKTKTIGDVHYAVDVTFAITGYPQASASSTAERGRLWLPAT
ncbi:hypothetical protein [Pseudomonas sp. RT6P73]